MESVSFDGYLVHQEEKEQDSWDLFGERRAHEEAEAADYSRDNLDIPDLPHGHHEASSVITRGFSDAPGNQL